jgi:Tfp pilus assembly protein PilE
MKHSKGFTVIELLVTIVFLGVATVILFTQRNNLTATQRDSDRKTAINAMYYNLEEVFYAKNGYYPSKIDETNLTAMDPALFTDPDGNKINTSNTDYRFEATNCSTDNKCRSYTLRGLLEKEADFVKTSKH